MALFAVFVLGSWWGSALHVFLTPNYRFQTLEKSKGLWIALTVIGCLPACWYYLISLRPKLKAVKDQEPPLKSLL